MPWDRGGEVGIGRKPGLLAFNNKMESIPCKSYIFFPGIKKLLYHSRRPSEVTNRVLSLKITFSKHTRICENNEFPLMTAISVPAANPDKWEATVTSMVSGRKTGSRVWDAAFSYPSQTMIANSPLMHHFAPNRADKFGFVGLGIGLNH